MAKVFSTLTHDDLEKCQKFAQELTDRHQSTRNTQRIKKAVDPLNTNWITKAAEVAVARYLGLEPQFTVNPHRGGDGGYDMKIPIDGQTFGIDVKSTTNPNGERLIWPKRTPMDQMADILCFAKTSPLNSEGFGTFQLCGWITGWQFKKLHTLSTPNEVGLDEATPYMFANSLTPMEFLKR